MVGRGRHDDQRATDDDAPQSPSANIEHRLTTQYDGATPSRSAPGFPPSSWGTRFQRCRRRIFPVSNTAPDVLCSPQPTRLSFLKGVRWSMRVLPLRSRRCPAQPNVSRVSFPGTSPRAAHHQRRSLSHGWW